MILSTRFNLGNTPNHIFEMHQCYMSKKKHRNSTKFESLKYLTQGFNGDLIHRIDLKGNNKTEK